MGLGKQTGKTEDEIKANVIGELHRCFRFLHLKEGMDLFALHDSSETMQKEELQTDLNADGANILMKMQELKTADQDQTRSLRRSQSSLHGYSGEHSIRNCLRNYNLSSHSYALVCVLNGSLHCTGDRVGKAPTVLGFGEAADIRRFRSYSHAVARSTEAFKGGAEVLVITSKDLVKVLMRLEAKDCSTREKVAFLRSTRAFQNVDERKM